MSINLSDCSRDGKRCEMRVGVETAELVYQPNAYTPQVESELRSALETNRPSVGMAELLAGVLISWEVLDEEGERVEPSLENLMVMPSVLLGAALTAISADISGDVDRKNSAGGSRRKGSSGKSLNGTQS
jgi:hypothetical protein